MWKKGLILISGAFLSLSGNLGTVDASAISHYDVVKRVDVATIDGKIDEKVWANVPVISGVFHYPWETKEAPYTEFKAYNDGINMYFYFKVKDDNVVFDNKWKSDESTVDNEDRVEIFFAGQNIDKPGLNGMEKYYAFEIDPLGRVHDYSAEYYRHFDSKWNLAGLETKAVIEADGYTVEGKMPLNAFDGLINENNIVKVGVYRAEYSKVDGQLIAQWISWVDPKTSAPDYHVASSFGDFRILK